MEKITTKAGDYKIYRGSEAPRKPEEHQPDKWYFEPGNYVGFTVFSDAYESIEDAKKAAVDTGAREERLQNEIGGGG
jgi:hypothetical protein